MNIEKILEDILSGTDFEVYGITENNVELEITAPMSRFSTS